MSATTTKKRPILFSAPMVNALLAGTKTQTRRIVKPQPGNHESDDGHGVMHRCPYGSPGERLWVRETWALKTGSDIGHHSRVIYAADQSEKLIHWQDGHDIPNRYGFDLSGRERNRPSIHMPRWASRVTLEITDVRVQRLQEISEDDAKAEGVEASKRVTVANGAPCYSLPFRRLWESINGVDSWSANPWVWAISFKRAQP